MMTAAQNEQFKAAVGHDATGVWTFFGYITFTIMLLWVAWLAWGLFRAWRDGSAKEYDMLWSFLRACVLLSLLGSYLQ